MNKPAATEAAFARWWNIWDGWPIKRRAEVLCCLGPCMSIGGDAARGIADASKGKLTPNEFFPLMRAA
jgi:hypothetical protein